MKEKSQIEKKAEEKQITLLSTALSEASNCRWTLAQRIRKGIPALLSKGCFCQRIQCTIHDAAF